MFFTNPDFIIKYLTFSTGNIFLNIEQNKEGSGYIGWDLPPSADEPDGPVNPGQLPARYSIENSL